MKSKLVKYLVRTVAVILIITTALFIANKISPYPSALLIRYAFNSEAVKVNKALQKYLPENISSIKNQQYRSNDKDGFLNVYYPSQITNTDSALTTIVWIHGGGWISGCKEQVENYCKILAGKGFTVVAIDYSIAPEKKYPTPVLQTNAALGYLVKNAKRFHINSNRLFLAGDSGGAHIAAQTATCINQPEYANLLGINPSITRLQLLGVILFCGPFNVNEVNMQGSFASFLKTVLWSYSGTKDFLNDNNFKTASVVNYINANFPPAFISVGNADPLASQSYNLASKLSQLNVSIDTLFYDAGHLPKLQHEYQFNLDSEAGNLALQRSVNFILSTQNNLQ